MTKEKENVLTAHLLLSWNSDVRDRLNRHYGVSLNLLKEVLAIVGESGSGQVCIDKTFRC